MDKATITVLLVEDDADEAWLLEEALRVAGARDIGFIRADCIAAASKILSERTVDAILLDLSLPDSVGIETVAAMLRIAGEAPVIVCTGLHDESLGQEAIRAGAQDYLVKNPRLYGAVPRILRFAVERSRITQAANRRVDQARRYTEMLLTNVISAVDSGLAITDQCGKFLVVNPALAELYGGSGTELHGRDWTDILASERQESELQAYCRSMANGEAFHREQVMLRRADGNSVAVSVRSKNIGHGEESHCRVLSFDKRSDLGPDCSECLSAKLNGHVGDSMMQLTAGRIQTVGLRKVRSALGSHWNSIAESVYTIGERIIRARLSPQDTYMRNSDGDFIICFARLSEKDACLEARALGREIHETILGDEGGEVLSDRALEPALRSEIASLESEAHTIELAPSDLEKPAALANLVTDKIKTSAARVQADTEAQLADLHESCKARLREVHKQDKRTGTLMIHELDPDARLRADRLIRSAGDDPSVTAEVDFIVLGSATQRIYSMGVSKNPLVAVDVHHSTLDDNALCNKYLSICRSLDRRATSSLVFNIRGVPPETHTTRVGWFASALRPYSRLRMIQVRQPSLGALDLQEADIAVITVDYDDVKGAFYRDLDCAKDFVRQMHTFGARVLIDRVNAIDGGHLFQDLGVDFISYGLEAALVA